MRRELVSLGSRPPLSLRLEAARHELRCEECRVTWLSWWRRLIGDRRGYTPHAGGSKMAQAETDVPTPPNEGLRSQAWVVAKPVALDEWAKGSADSTQMLIACSRALDAALAGVPDGWAKIRGRWVQLTDKAQQAAMGVGFWPDGQRVGS